MTAPLAAPHDALLLDLDGVVYVGDHAVPGAVDAIAAARVAGLGIAFVTNNASRPPADVAAHLVDLGVPAVSDDVVTSAQAGARVLADTLAARSRVLAVGGPGVAEALEHVGLVAVRSSESRSGEVSAVLQGFGPDVSWRDLAAAALAISRGATWVVTNTDPTLPVPGGLAPGNGSLAQAVAAAAGRPPDVIAGKPFPSLMLESIARLGAHAPLAVGDRLDTDIAGAVQAGVPALLVLTGVAGIADVLAAAPGQRPDFLGADLGALSQPPAATSGPAGPRAVGEWWGVGTARASALGGHLRVEIGDSGWLAALQAACAATWAAPGTVDVGAAADAIDAARRTVEP